MTDLLYQNDSYLKEFDTNVINIEEELHAVELGQTCFYPGGGGQPNDTGKIICHQRVIPVINVRKKGDIVFHYLDKQYPLPEIGDHISGIIDWDRRYKLMRTHTALHVLCGVVFRDYHALVTGGDMDLSQGRMDFEFENMQKELVQLIESAINIEVTRLC